MGMTCPPIALTKEEYDKRVNAGARTMVEIDPAFHRWLENGKMARRVVVVVAVVVLLVVVLILGL